MTPAPQPTDAPARDRIRNSLQESLLVEAAAGTGKTTELVRRIVNVLAQGLTTIDRIVAVTFTHKAAGELKLRLRSELDCARSNEPDPAQSANLEHALAHLEEAAIGTIHSFCAQILRERPVEARIDPAFEELDEGGARRVYDSVFKRWLQDKLSLESPGLRRALTRLSAQEEREVNFTPLESLNTAGWALMEWRDFPTAWMRPDLDREDVIDTLVDRIKPLAARASRYNNEVSEPVRDILPWIEREPRDYDTLEGLLFKLYRRWSRRKDSVPDKDLFATIAKYRPVYDADLAAQLRTELWELTGRYEESKRRSGQLDFVDLLLLVRNLIRDNGEVRAYLQNKYSHLFVDEFQDTDPLQAEILLILAAGNPNETDWLAITPAPGKLFLVGDPKQSIYRFRRADVALYQLLRDRLQGRGIAVLELSQSFRSVRAIQQCVNYAFAKQMTGSREVAQADYVPLEPFRGGIDGQPSVIALPAPFPYGSRSVSNVSIDKCLPDAITGFVEWLIRSSNWRVWDPGDKELRPIRSGDICILFRRFTNFFKDITRDYVRSLEDRGIPHLLVGSKTFHEREEIDTMRAALTAIEWPEDELAVFATLKGALFAIPDAVLLRFRAGHGKLDPLGDLAEDLHADFQDVKTALAILRDLHAQRNQRPIAETVYLLLESTRSWAAFASRPAGNQVLANVRRIIDLARAFESTGSGYSFRGFVHELSSAADRAESAEAPVLEEGADGVRIMTVHAAKGLEFPIVILADMTAQLAHENPSRYVDPQQRLCALRIMGCAPFELFENKDNEAARDTEEGKRVAYVAATRARDLLVIPAVGDEERKGWLSPLNNAIYPSQDKRRVSASAPGCPALGPMSVLDRPPEYAGEISVKPGLHIIGGNHEVVWWDPQLIPPSREEQFSARQEEMFAEEPVSLQKGLDDHARWSQRRSQLLEAGAKPTLQLALASEVTEPPASFTGELFVEATARPSGRPTGARFGALVHSTLRDVPLWAARPQIEATARMQARILGAERDETSAAVIAVLNVLRHPLLERARAVRRCHREYPVLLHLDKGTALEGIIDLAFEEDAGWVVVDFKTDADISQLLTRYRAQISWYAEALHRITQRPVQAYLLAV
ncbi:MAG: UvrD-helicase domain-containing protein [Acidobacteria bacterium]|nr:UvrD-helicase domain-containing protein [Acidobacteriota bacterium]